MVYDEVRSAELRVLAERLGDPALNEALADEEFVSFDGGLSLAVDVRVMAALLNRVVRLEDRVEKLEGRKA